MESLTLTPDREDNENMLIADCRPFVNAYANTVAGGGYEAARVYDGCNVEFLDIANIHAVRGAHQRLREAAGRGGEGLVSVDAGDWLLSLGTILEGAQKVATAVDVRHESVLVHCSDGWDYVW